MRVSINQQASIFIITVFVGFFIGFIYDLFRIFRKTLKHPNILIQVEDLLYWIFVSLTMFYILLHKNYGEVRAFSIIGAFLGMIIYFLTLSQIFVPITVKVINFVKKCIAFIIKVILIPIKFIIKLLSYPYNFFKKLLSKFKRTSIKVGRKSKTKLKRAKKGLTKEMKIIFKKK